MYKSRECIIKLLYNIHSYACILATISRMNIPAQSRSRESIFREFRDVR